MTNTITTTALTHRNLLLMINEADEVTFNPFKAAKEIMLSLKHDVITFKQYDDLCKQLEYECKRNRVETQNEFVSLF
jgi:hypothetical protein